MYLELSWFIFQSLILIHINNISLYYSHIYVQHNLYWQSRVIYMKIRHTGYVFTYLDVMETLPLWVAYLPNRKNFPVTSSRSIFVLIDQRLQNTDGRLNGDNVNKIYGWTGWKWLARHYPNILVILRLVNKSVFYYW